MRDLREHIRASPMWAGLDAILVAPPVSLLESPNLALHQLQALAEQAGFRVRVLYADHLFASFIGRENFELLSHSLTSPYEQFGERLFCSFAFPELPAFGRRAAATGLEYASPRTSAFEQIQWRQLNRLYESISPWLHELSDLILELGVSLVGFSTSHQQTTASIAIARELKKRSQEVLTAIGGSNCHGQMAFGLAEGTKGVIDFIFSGESEDAWIELLRGQKTRSYPVRPHIFPSTPPASLNDLPKPDFGDYFEQIAFGDWDQEEIWVNLESSRGCWWGQTYLCTFCGINGETLKYRAKSPEKVLAEISDVMRDYPSARVRMTDVLMPRNYLKSVLPKIAAEHPHITLFYEQRADLDLEEVLTLKSSGVTFLQIGIEHFADSMLRRINKGTIGADNIAVLRYARSAGCAVGWNLLSEVPGDTEEEWLLLLDLLPQIHHLSPPTLLRPLEITRFSPYFDAPSLFDIQELKPLDVYEDIFPTYVDKSKVAWLFTGQYECHSRNSPELMREVHSKVEEWKKKWLVPIGDIPSLEVHKYGQGQYLLRDTRNVNSLGVIQFIDERQASVALFGDRGANFNELASWATEAKVVAQVSGRSVGLATGSPALIREFDKRYPAPPLSRSQRMKSQTMFKRVSSGEFRAIKLRN